MAAAKLSTADRQRIGVMVGMVIQRIADEMDVTKETAEREIRMVLTARAQARQAEKGAR